MLLIMIVSFFCRAIVADAVANSSSAKFACLIVISSAPVFVIVIDDFMVVS